MHVRCCRVAAINSIMRYLHVINALGRLLGCPAFLGSKKKLEVPKLHSRSLEAAVISWVFHIHHLLSLHYGWRLSRVRGSQVRESNL